MQHNNTAHLTVTLASQENVDTIVAIWDDADEWMRQRGISPEPPPVPLREIVAEQAADGTVYVGCVPGEPEPVGTFTLELEDDGVWADMPAEAAYLHGLAVRRDLAGHAIGLSLLRYAEGLAAKHGKPLLRLDCTAGNAALRAYYVRSGFTYRGDVQLEHRRASRYERVVQRDRKWTG